MITKFKIFENDNIGYTKFCVSGSYSQHDNNIDKLIEQVNQLKEKNIEYYVIQHHEPNIYFNIYCFPKDDEENIFINDILDYCNIWNFLPKDIETSKKFAQDNSIKGDITKEHIELLCTVDKYNL